MIPEQVRHILEKLENSGFEAYLVGGFVRDSLLNKKTNDFDIATSATPKDIVTIFGPPKKDIICGSYNMNLTNEINVDITTFRREGSYNNHIPFEVEYTSDIKEDAIRRDFTINAIYMDKDGNLVDPLNGLNDLQNKTIRVIGNANKRLEEDPIRILRAVRFQASYNFKIHEELLNAIIKNIDLLDSIRTDLILRELNKILLNNGFHLLNNYNMLKPLGIITKEIVYVPDIEALWAQINVTKKYPHKKNNENAIELFKSYLKLGVVNANTIYKYGYYKSSLVAEILGIKEEKIKKIYMDMPIHTRKDIVLSTEEILSIACVKGKDIGNLLNDIENNILNGTISNNRDSITNYINERRLSHE